MWDWYTGTAYNRLMPGGAIIVINHGPRGKTLHNSFPHAGSHRHLRRGVLHERRSYSGIDA